jgi:membrane protease YdiL (CAAX protease family)
MKKIHEAVFKTIEYILFFFIFVIKPLFTTNVSTVLTPSWYSLFFYLIFCLWLVLSSSLDLNSSVALKKNSFFIHSMVFPSLQVLILLFINMLVWNFFTTCNISVFKKTTMITIDLVGGGHLAKFCLILQLIGAAFFEELLFRQYFPCRAASFLKQFKYNKITKIVFVEILPIFAFAIGHIYLGDFGFMNALIAGFILRILYKKTHSVLPVCIVHSTYNLVIIIFSIL